MAIGDYDVLARASRALRSAPEPGWAAIEQRVLDAVRAAPRGGWPIAVHDPAPDTAPGRIRVRAPGRIRVSDLVLRTLIARRVTEDPDVALVDVEVTLDGETLRTIDIEVSGRFGSDLPRAADRVRAIAHAVVADAIGADDVVVSVAVTDVHR
ncbi:hypothetical protein FHR72_000206 [Mycolicibacterium iranicum]|uniref:Asp23/Gls24 family envelope stress response protein n=1 Tax=Mycolicibacterium iranicum TaxID=912594 RepID=A0A839PZ67_MYCIR|nr:hypothetical protein [Mycolicibacterium iranicum]MBB2988749.1 hypothetical protein [Mycolicibacterium iranicum]